MPWEVVVLKGREPGPGAIHLVPSGPTSASGQAPQVWRGTKSTHLNCIYIFSKAMVENGESGIGHSPFTRTFLINCSSCLVPGKLSLKINLWAFIRKQMIRDPTCFSLSLLILASRKLRVTFIVQISFAQFRFLIAPICFFLQENFILFHP